MLGLKEKIVRLARETRGAEIAESALVLPLMFMMLLGIFWFGQAFRIYGTITHAAREGARAGASPSCTSCVAGNTASKNAYDAVQSALAAGKLDVSKAKRPSPVPSLISCLPGGGAQVCDSSYPKICIQRNVKLSIGSGVAGVCGISVSFEYPYQFTFPGVSVNNQLIEIQAAARMRMETQ